MGNCGQKVLLETNDKVVYGDVNTQPLRETHFEEADTKDIVEEDNDAFMSNKEDEEIHQEITRTDDHIEYQDYYHINDDEGIQDYSEWDIIEFEYSTPFVDGDGKEVIASDGFTPSDNPCEENNTATSIMQQMVDIGTCSKRSGSTVQFPMSDGHTLNTVYEDRELSENDIITSMTDIACIPNILF